MHLREEDDYLFQADVVYHESLQQESVELWKRLLADITVPMNQADRHFISFFLVLFRISMLKFTMNMAYVQDGIYMVDWPFHEERKHENAHISPSLRAIYQFYLQIPMCYPLKFIVAFPDVIRWAMGATGSTSLKLTFEDYENLDTKKLGTDILLQIVQLYRKTTSLDLECGMLKA